jgi:hypothetical protein
MQQVNVNTGFKKIIIYRAFASTNWLKREKKSKERRNEANTYLETVHCNFMQLAFLELRRYWFQSIFIHRSEDHFSWIVLQNRFYTYTLTFNTFIYNSYKQLPKKVLFLFLFNELDLYSNFCLNPLFQITEEFGSLLYLGSNFIIFLELLTYFHPVSRMWAHDLLVTILNYKNTE